MPKDCDEGKDLTLTEYKHLLYPRREKTVFGTSVANFFVALIKAKLRNGKKLQTYCNS